jgi:hypothetical protein
MHEIQGPEAMTRVMATCLVGTIEQVAEKFGVLKGHEFTRAAG